MASADNSMTMAVRSDCACPPDHLADHSGGHDGGATGQSPCMADPACASACAMSSTAVLGTGLHVERAMIAKPRTVFDNGVRLTASAHPPYRPPILSILA